MYQGIWGGMNETKVFLTAKPKFFLPQYISFLKSLQHIYEPTICYENNTKQCLKDVGLVHVHKTLMIL